MKWKITKLKPSQDVGAILAKTRHDLGWSLHKMKRDFCLPKSFIEAVEGGSYDKLPDQVYAKALLKKYIKLLDLPVKEYIDLWEEQYLHWQKLEPAAIKGNALPPQAKVGWQITPAFWKRGIVMSLGVVFLIYLGVQVEAAIAPAELQLVNPADQITIFEYSIEVKGQTEPEVTVLINNHEVPVDNSGKFSKQVNLQKGLNILTIEAAKKYRPSKIITRHILVADEETK